MYTYNCHNTEIVNVALGVSNINAYFYWSSGMFRWFTGLKSSNVPTSNTTALWKRQISQLLLNNVKRLEDRGQSVFIFEELYSILVYAL